MVQVYEDPGTGQQQGSGEWSFKSAIAKGLAGTIGILAALAIDYIQKGDASALLYATKLINTTALSRFHVEAVPAYIYLAVLLIAGFAMVYIFEPTNKRNAFYAGAGVLGFLATFSPIAQQTLQIPSAAELPSLDSLLQATQTAPDGTPVVPAPAPSTPAPATPGPAGHAFNDSAIVSIVPKTLGAQPGEMVVAQAETNIPVNIVVMLPGAGATGTQPEVRVSLHETAAGRTQILGAGRFAKTDGRLAILYQTNVGLTPGGNTNVTVRVEAEGYTIVEKPFTITPGMRIARIDVPLVASNTPLSVQRLNYPYRW